MAGLSWNWWRVKRRTKSEARQWTSSFIGVAFVFCFVIFSRTKLVRNPIFDVEVTKEIWGETIGFSSGRITTLWMEKVKHKIDSCWTECTGGIEMDASG